MMKSSTLKRITVAFAMFMIVAVLPAAAVSFDFDHLGRGAAFDFLPSDGIAATGGDLASSDVDSGILNGDLTFFAGGITAFVTGTYLGDEVAAVQDHDGDWSDTVGAGLGVYHTDPVDGSDDNITANEVLTITFDRLVTLSSIGLRADGHDFTGWIPDATFLLDGSDTLMPINVGSIDVNLTGTSFTFAYGGRTPDQFYVASLEAREVPESGATAILLGLSMLGLRRLRKRHARN